MSRFGTTDYNPSGSSDSNGGDYEDLPSFLLDSYSIITFELSDVGVYEGDYGQSMIMSMYDIEVLEGVVTERIDDGDGNADEKVKVFGWDRWFNRDDETKELQPLTDDGEVSADALPTVESQDAGGDTYRYRVEDPILEGKHDSVNIGDAELWLSNGKKARTLAKVLSESGPDVINSDAKREEYGWLNLDDDFDLREELEGRRMMMWIEPITLDPEDDDNDLEPGEDEPITFTDAVLLDAETEAGITVKNGGSDGGSDDGSSSESSDSSEASDDSDDEPVDVEFPGWADELISMFARTNQNNRESIQGILRDEAPDDYELNMDAIMAEIEARS